MGGLIGGEARDVRRSREQGPAVGDGLAGAAMEDVYKRQGAHAALLRVALQGRCLALVDRLFAALADQLVDSRQSFSPFTSCLFRLPLYR